MHERVFKCPVCGDKRICLKRRNTAVGHIKTMYCYVCKEDRDFIQIEEGEEWATT